MVETEEFKKAMNDAEILGAFKRFCGRLAKEPVYAQRLRNLFFQSVDRERMVRQIFEGRLGISLPPGEEERMAELVEAFFRKKSFRQRIPQETRERLLAEQNRKCAFCGADVDGHAPVDHIVPFKYVGDALANNYQILCGSCNEHKNASIDYQIRALLHLV